MIGLSASATVNCASTMGGVSTLISLTCLLWSVGLVTFISVSVATPVSFNNTDEIQFTSLKCQTSEECSCSPTSKYHYAICYEGRCACSIKPDPHTTCKDHKECSCLHGIPICHEGYCYCLPDYIVLEEMKESIGL